MRSGPLAFAILFGTTGCVRYQARPISPADGAAALETRRLDDPGVRTFIEGNLGRELSPWPPWSWDLHTLTLAAFYYHPDLDVARARWAIASGGVVTAGALPNPTLSLSPEYVLSSGNPSPWIFGFRLDIPLQTYGKRGYRVAQARASGEAARLGVAGAAWQVRSRLRSSLLGLWVAGTRFALIERERSIQEEIAGLIERRRDVGEASEQDLTRERIELERLRVAARNSETQRAQGRAHVAAAIGVPAAALEQVEISFEAFDVTPPANPPESDLRRRALLGRADVEALLAEYAAAQAALQLEIARQYPDLSLGPGYSWSQGANHYLIGISLTLPLFNRNQGPIAEAEARRKEVAARFTGLQARILGDLDRALSGYLSASRAAGDAESLLYQERLRQGQVERAFSAGEADRVALAGANLQLAAAEVSRFDARVEQVRLLGELEDALQRPLSGPEPPFGRQEPEPQRREEHRR